MKKIIIATVASLFFGFSVEAQNLSLHEVPSVILNKMQHDFPQAKDVEWEMKGVNYEVEFELGAKDRDHEILYNPIGEVLYHKQEISKNDLPSKIVNKINTDFPNYRISDVSKIHKGKNISYRFEVKSGKEEWELEVDESGNILSKKQD